MLSSLKNWLGFAPSAEDLFADAVKAVLVAEGATSFVYDRAKFAFVDGRKTIYLRNIFGRCLDMSPKEQVRLLKRFVRGVLVPPRQITGVRDLADDVVPVMRSRAEVALHRLVAEAAGAERPEAMELPFAPFAGELVVTLGINQADAIQRVSPPDLERVGMTVADLLPRAKANLRRLHPMTGFAPFASSGLFHATEAENYQASMLLYPPGQALQFPVVEGTPLLMVPTRDMMFLVGSDNTRSLEALLDLVFDKYVDWHHRCTTALWTWRDEQWVEWQPPAGSAVRRKWSNCQVVGRATQYVMQKGALEALHRRTGRDIHVAKYKMAIKDDEVHATCAWAEGVTEALLPKTDTITFVPQKGPPFIVPWAAVERIAGHRLEPMPEYYPERVRVRTFPTAEQCAAFEVIQAA
jgi:hypothetical protein